MRRILGLLIVLTLCLTSAAKNQTYAVVVGISDYKYPNICPSLGGMTVKSARKAANFFHRNRKSETFMLLDGNATRDHILRVMKAQFSKADKDDIIMFIFSGHGYQGGLTTYAFDGSASSAVTSASRVLRLSTSAATACASSLGSRASSRLNCA